MSKKNFTVARIVTHTQAGIGKCERHNERKNESYSNMNVDLGRTPMNIHLSTPTGKCHFSPGWDVIFWRSACDGYAALITRYLSA